ncbi:Ig-like domain-containing protein [Rhizobium glycinendophyticum]|uniref:Tandem-95 repeat protein n=1 Tax=Rhizobium glycinendophyticum TaxID=2589807 RepID=A0A504U5K1_9HYPH|nr:Ig-like domain-containing protein [Rhizobium glycinendophyticum]TPP10288.1 tandem-95 repeat protein [Rhizobium glycinendophyticum]
MSHSLRLKQVFILLLLSLAAFVSVISLASAADVSLTFQAGVAGRQAFNIQNKHSDYVTTGPAFSGSVPGLDVISVTQSGPRLVVILYGTPTTPGTYTGTIRHDYRELFVDVDGSEYWTTGGTDSWTWEVTVLPAPPAVSSFSVTYEADSSGNVANPQVESGATLAVATQPTHGTVTVEGDYFAYTPTAGYTGTDSFTYTATKNGSTSAAATVSITVRPPIPGAGTYSTRVPGNSTNYALTLIGSPSLTGANIVRGPQHGTATISGLTVYYTPTADYYGTDTIDYVVYNDYGTSDIAQITITVTPPAPDLSDSTATVAANGSGVVLDLSDSGPIDQIMLLDEPAHGTVSVSDTSITYTPAAGYSGTDRLSYRAFNGGGYDEASVSITVTAPTLAIAPSTLPAAQVGSSYSETFSATLGTAPYTFAATGLPDGLTLSEDGTLSGIPEEAGDFTVSVTATDSLGATGEASLSLTVLPDEPVAEDVSATVAEGTSDNAITLSLSGGAAASVTVASAPAHGTATASGTSILYTPTSGYIGTDSFTYTATNAAGTSQPATVSITITSTAEAITLTPDGGALDEAMAGEAYSASISASGGTGSLVFSLTSGSLPEGVTLNVSTGALNGPLSEDATVGDYAFTLTATDSRGETGSADFSLSVVERAVTITDTTVTVAEGASPPDLYLNNKATGGPFTSAAVVAVSPSNAGTAEIVSGELASTSSSTPVGYYLRFTPSVYFTGNARVVYKLSSAIGVANGTVTYTLTADDQQVANAVDSAVRDFVGERQNLLSNQIHVPSLKDRRRMAQATEPVTVTANGSDATGAATFGFATSLAAVESARRIAAGEDRATAGLGDDFNLWLDGSVQLYRDDGTGDWGTFGLFNLGADYLISDHLLVGLSLHLDRMSDPTDEDERLTGLGWLAGPYASMEIARDIFLDTSLRYGGSANDIEAGDWTGDFDTRRWMADIALSGEWQVAPDTMLTPTMRLVYFDENVDAYEISDGAGSILGIDGFNERQLRANLGLDLAHEIELSNGLQITPSAGVKLGYAALDGNGLFGSMSAGLGLSDGSGWNVDAKLLYSVESGGSQSLGANLGLRVRF